MIVNVAEKSGQERLMFVNRFTFLNVAKFFIAMNGFVVVRYKVSVIHLLEPLFLPRVKMCVCVCFFHKLPDKKRENKWVVYGKIIGASRQLGI